MTTEGYKSNQLSDEMERRIKERLKQERGDLRTNQQMSREYMEAICDGRISALEWVLNEAEAVKLQQPERRERPVTA
jgi:LPS O-antigen subunit length determinant protein (WzzB/FepE family)